MEKEFPRNQLPLSCFPWEEQLDLALGSLPVQDGRENPSQHSALSEVMDTFFTLFPPVLGPRCKIAAEVKPSGATGVTWQICGILCVLVLSLNFSTKTPQEFL